MNLNPQLKIFKFYNFLKPTISKPSTLIDFKVKFVNKEIYKKLVQITH